MNWKRAKFDGSRSSSLLNESELRDRDAAARWLRTAEKKKVTGKPKKRRRQPMKREDMRQGPTDLRPGLVIYTDGACEPNPGRGGWGFVAYMDGREIHSDCGGAIEATNNIMEITGVIRALEWLISSEVRQFTRVLSDSQYVVKGCNDWRHGWKKRDWKRIADHRSKTMEPIKNVDLWKQLDRLLIAAPAKIEWVKGHAGIVGNERADELSQVGRKAAINAASVNSLIADQLRYSV